MAGETEKGEFMKKIIVSILFLSIIFVLYLTFYLNKNINNDVIVSKEITSDIDIVSSYINKEMSSDLLTKSEQLAEIYYVETPFYSNIRFDGEKYFICICSDMEYIRTGNDYIDVNGENIWAEDFGTSLYKAEEWYEIDITTGKISDTPEKEEPKNPSKINNTGYYYTLDKENGKVISNNFRQGYGYKTVIKQHNKETGEIVTIYTDDVLYRNIDLSYSSKNYLVIVYDIGDDLLQKYDVLSIPERKITTLSLFNGCLNKNTTSFLMPLGFIGDLLYCKEYCPSKSNYDAIFKFEPSTKKTVKLYDTVLNGCVDINPEFLIIRTQDGYAIAYTDGSGIVKVRNPVNYQNPIFVCSQKGIIYFYSNNDNENGNGKHSSIFYSYNPKIDKIIQYINSSERNIEKVIIGNDSYLCLLWNGVIKGKDGLTYDKGEILYGKLNK